MRDGLLKRGDTWSYVVRIRDPKTGKMKPRWVGGFKLRADALRARDDARDRVHKGTLAIPSKVTLKEYLELWLEGMDRQVRATTLRSYTMHVREHIAPVLGFHRLQAITPGMINAFYAKLLKDGRVQKARVPAAESDDKAATTDPKPKPKPKKAKAQTNPGLSPNSVRRIAATLHRALRDAVDEGALTRNPASLAKLPKASAGVHRDLQVWTAEELANFLDASAANEKDWAFPIFHLAAYTGMRRGELCGLRWSDVDLDAGSLSVQHTRVVVGTDTTEGPPKTAQGRRTVDLDKRTVQVLKAHRKAQDEERFALGRTTERDYVFDQYGGQPLHPDYVTRLFNSAVKRYGLKRIRFHDLRHTHATLMLGAGMPLKVVSERLGHSTAAFTMTVYQHVLPGQQVQAAEQFAALVGAAGSRGVANA